MGRHCCQFNASRWWQSSYNLCIRRHSSHCVTMLYRRIVYRWRETIRRILPWSTFRGRHGGLLRLYIFLNSATNLPAYRMPYRRPLQRLRLGWEHHSCFQPTSYLSSAYVDVHRYHCIYLIFQCLRCLHHQIRLSCAAIYRGHMQNAFHLGYWFGHTNRGIQLGRTVRLFPPRFRNFGI